MSADVEIPHRYRPIADSPHQSCADCFASPTNPTFAEHHALPKKSVEPAKAAVGTTSEQAGKE